MSPKKQINVIEIKTSLSGAPLMKFHQISHACHIIESDQARLIFDPVFFEFSKTANEVFPQARVFHKKIASQKYDGIFISHSHEDHFCLRSLSFFDRATPIYFYGNITDELSAIQAMGFNKITLLEMNQSAQVKDISVTTIDNILGPSECGFLTQTASHRILNLVDCRLSKEDIRKINTRGPFDLTLFPFQEHQISHLYGGSFGAEVNLKAHHERLLQAAEIETDCVVPSSCQIQVKEARWRNQRAFPIARRRFMHDLGVITKQNKRTLELLPGDSLQLSSAGSLKRIRAAGFVRLKVDRKTDYQFDLDKAPPALHLEYPTQNKRIVRLAYEKLKRTFAPALTGVKSYPSLAPFFEENVSLQIEVINGTGSGLRPLQYRFNSKGVHLVKSKSLMNCDFKIQIHARILIRNFVEGAPAISLLDGMRGSGQFLNLKTGRFLRFSEDSNPLASFFLMYSVNLDRSKAIEDFGA